MNLREQLRRGIFCESDCSGYKMKSILSVKGTDLMTYSTAWMKQKRR